MKKKVLSLLLAGLMTAGTLAGCGSEESTDSGDDVQKVTILCHASWRNDGNQAAFEYVEEKLNVQLEFEEVPEGDSGEQLIFAKITNGESPDILWWQGASTANVKMGADLFENLSDIRDWGADYDTEALATKIYTIDDRQIVAPFGDATVFGMCYNKQIFEENNIEIPTTWEEFESACETLKAAGVIPMYLSGKDAWTLQIIGLDAYGKEYAGDSSLVEEMDTHQKTFSDMDIMKGALNEMVTLVEKGYVQETFLSDTYVDAQTALLDGTCAMYPMASYIQPELAKIADEAELENLGMFAIPGTDGQQIATVSTPSGFYVPSDGENIELAKEVVAELSSKEAAEAMYGVQSGIPFIQGVDGNAIGILKDASDIMNNDEIVKPVGPADLTKYQKGPLETYIQDMLVGNRTADEVLQSLDDDFAKQANDAGDENWQ